MRSIVAALIVAVALSSVSPVPTSAKGMPLKGQLIGSHWTAGTTGNCVCDLKWYTFAANRGRAEVDAKLLGAGLPFSPTYGLRVYIYRGNAFVTWGQTACYKQQKICNQMARIRFTAAPGALYYIKVDGPGAEDVRYQLAVHARLRTLHCGKVCS